MALIDITLPADQAEGTENVVAAWFKQVGDAVTANEPLLEISTDKVTVEIAAPATGVLREMLKADGDKVEEGEVLGRIEAGASADTSTAPVKPAPPADEPSVQPSTRPEAELSPAVRRLLKEHGLDSSAIAGTGKGGRITVEDVEAHLAGGPSTRPSVPSHRVPHSQMRRSIAEHMVRSVAAAPHVTSVFEVDLSAVKAHREAHREAFRARDVRLTYTAYFVRAAVEAIRAVPEANARWHDDALELWEDMNVGIATALGAGGLIVPVLHRAQDLELLATARAVNDLTARARDGKLAPREVRDGTFSISNHGVSGSLIAAPIVIVQPQSAILGIGRLEERAVVRDGAVVARPMLYVSLTIDHRVLDGFSANAFLSKWVETIEGWSPDAA